ncbi:hypothetical protein FM104_01845 [Microbacterium esteraromaticum]|uniref:HNH nuclease domain-containing protein n=2 Tax=Microbacterium esteraromaticum TaxID=57043 RepID=A0A1R4IGJ3_9MICO|nr:hypothetical protein FM104_01845 [Microbacterium esteraromaticum]
MVAASDEQMDVLDALVTMARDIERSIDGMQAARDGVLTLANRLALSMAEDAGGADAADLTLRSVSAELATALRVSDRTIQRRMADADLKVERFPAVWAAQGAGRISAGRSRVIADAGLYIDDVRARAAYAERVLEFAEDESPNRLRPIAQRLAQQYQPRSMDERHAQARQSRSVWVKDQGEGMAELGILGPAALVHGAFERLTAMAKAVARAGNNPGPADCPSAGDAVADHGCADEGYGAADAGAERGESGCRTDADHPTHDARGTIDPRTLSQTRADLALDLLLTGVPGGHDTADGLLSAITANISVTVPVTSLMSEGGPEAELDGRCPIDPGTARKLAGAASGWDRVLTHPITGGVLAVDRYRPSEALKRHLVGRDQRCRFPGCGMPARQSDLDHTKDAAFGGPTDDDNLAVLCRRHHVLKHHSPWHLRQLGDGLLEWTSPTRRVYIDKPPSPNTVTFTDDTAPDRPSGAPDDSDAGERTADPWVTVPESLLAPF